MRERTPCCWGGYGGFDTVRRRGVYQAIEGGSVPIDPRLLEILVCPACHGEIHPLDADAGLACEGCGRVYPIRDGIPVMLVDEASPPREPRGR